MNLWRCNIVSKKDFIVNERIKFPKIRVIDSNGKQLGILSRNEALDIAKERGLDLILVSNKGDVPVCKILDFGKYRYELAKKEKEAKKKKTVINIREIRFTPIIEEHDLNVKIKSIRKFLKRNDRVKLVVFFRGRQIAYKEKGFELIDKVAKAVEDIGYIDKKPAFESRRLIAILMPKKKGK